MFSEVPILSAIFGLFLVKLLFQGHSIIETRSLVVNLTWAQVFEQRPVFVLSSLHESFFVTVVPQPVDY